MADDPEASVASGELDDAGATVPGPPDAAWSEPPKPEAPTPEPPLPVEPGPAAPAGSEPTSRIQRLKIAAANARATLDGKRETSRVVGIAFDAVGEDVDAGGPVLSAALGFRVFLFFAPFVAFFVIMAGYLADLLNRDPHDLVRGTGIAKLTANSISSGRDLSAPARFAALVLVAYALVLSSRSFVKVLRIVHMLVWSERRTRLRSATRAGMVFIATVTAATALSAVIDALRQRSVIGGVVGLALYTLVPFCVWWAVSWWLPHGSADRLGLVPGAALFAVGTQALHIATVVWFPHSLQSKSELYGALGTALVLLFWAYLLGRLITLCAVLNLALERRRAPEPPSLPSWLTGVPLAGNWLERTWAWLVRREAREGDAGPVADR